MKRNGKQSTNLVGAALEYSDGGSRLSIVFLCIVSLLCAACNVAVPILQKTILENLDVATDEYLWLLAGVGVAGCVLLMLENFINISIMIHFRRELESAMESSLAYKEQPLLREKGVGTFAAAVTGDSEQLSRVLAASWFSIVFNLLGAIVSIVISARWNHYFLIITSVAYVVILVIIFVFNRISVHYFRKEKMISYSLGAKIREMVDTHQSIMSYSNYMDYQETFKVDLDERGNCAKASERATAAGASLVKLVKMVSLVVFFFVAVYELRAMKTLEEKYAAFPVFVALVSFFETIFAPIATLNTTYNYASKFRAFYDPYKGVVAHEGIGEIPANLAMELHHIGLIEDGVLVLDNIDFQLDKIYGVVGLEGEPKVKLLSYLRGEDYPPQGHIGLGGARIFEIEKNLRLSLLTFNPSPNEVFGSGLEFNITLGKQLLSDEEYEEKKNTYFQSVEEFFHLLDAGKIFTHWKSKSLVAMILNDFFAIDERLYRSKNVQNDVYSRFEAIKDRKQFIEEIGASIFAKKYAKRSRYDYLVHTLNLYSLDSRSFGVSGKRLPDSERSLLLLARFLLPETENPFVLIDPLEHLPIDSYKNALHAVKDATRGRKGLILCQDIDALKTWTDEVILFQDGIVVDHASHTKLLNRCKPYQKLCAQYGLSPRAKKKPAAKNEE